MLIDLIERTLERLRGIANKVSFMGPALARLTVGVVFIGTGWGKLHSLPDVTEFFASLNIPAPAFQARLAAGTEFFGGILVLVGFCTRLASLPLAFTMAVAIATAKRAELTGFSALLGFEEWSYLVFFLWLAVAGPGSLSLDALWIRLRGRRAPVRTAG